LSSPDNQPKHDRIFPGYFFFRRFAARCFINEERSAGLSESQNAREA
jgi:hypothetical protein